MVDFNRRAFAASGFELVIGWGRFVAPRVIEVETAGGIRRLTGERIYLNLGTRAAIPPVPGLREAGPLTHVEALKLDVLPAHLSWSAAATSAWRWRRPSGASAAR